jgi:D-arabinose 1-dehydrogenase-like Zn-dependent alcohol dehydrogenase
MKKTIIVVDGMGGGIGAELIAKLKAARLNADIIALGTNSTATERMLKAGATRGATGENAVRVSIGSGDFILGPIGIVIANSMMGEITPDIARCVLDARGKRFLIPLPNDHFTLAGVESPPLGKMIEKAVELTAAAL